MSRPTKQKTFGLYAVLDWIQGLWIAYMGEKYDEPWGVIVGGVIRNYALMDKQNLNFDHVKQYVLDNEEMKKLPGKQLLELMETLDAMKAKRSKPTLEMTSTVSLVPGNKRKIDFPVGGVRWTTSVVEHAIIEYYSAVSGYTASQAARRLLRGYMLADKRLNVDHFRAYIDRMMPSVPKDAVDDLNDAWDEFVKSRDDIKKERRIKKSK